MRGISKYVATRFGIASDHGVTAVEYGLIAALVAVTVISAVTLVGLNLPDMLVYIADRVTTPRA